MATLDDGDGDMPTARLYNSFAYVPAATNRNVLGIGGYVEEYPSPADLTTFMDNPLYGHEANFTVVQVNNGGYDPDNPSFEGNVDVQSASAMAYPTPLVYYSTGKGPLGEDGSYLSWLRYVLDQDDIPQTISTSYTNYEKNYPLDYARTVCDLFAQLGLRGVSVLFATGDWGVGQGDCKTDGNARFMPTLPASCPWVTSVGGTMGHDPENAFRISGGGFSD